MRGRGVSAPFLLGRTPSCAQDGVPLKPSDAPAHLVALTRMGALASATRVVPDLRR